MIDGGDQGHAEIGNFIEITVWAFVSDLYIQPTRRQANGCDDEVIRRGRGRGIQSGKQLPARHQLIKLLRIVWLVPPSSTDGDRGRPSRSQYPREMRDLKRFKKEVGKSVPAISDDGCSAAIEYLGALKPDRKAPGKSIIGRALPGCRTDGRGEWRIVFVGNLLMDAPV